MHDIMLKKKIPLKNNNKESLLFLVGVFVNRC